MQSTGQFQIQLKSSFLVLPSWAGSISSETMLESVRRYFKSIELIHKQYTYAASRETWLEMREENFLQSLGESGKENYRSGLRKFEQYFGKSIDEILKLREQDLSSDDINQKTRFETEIKRFHQYLLDEGYNIKIARKMTLGITQLFRFYGMSIGKGSRTNHTSADKLSKIVDKVLTQIFGETATTTISTAIYTYLEERYSLKPVDILNEPKLFKEALEKCLGESGASLVFRMILNQSSELKLQKVLWIYDPVEQRTKVAIP